LSPHASPGGDGVEGVCKPSPHAAELTIGPHGKPAPCHAPVRIGGLLRLEPRTLSVLVYPQSDPPPCVAFWLPATALAGGFDRAPPGLVRRAFETPGLQEAQLLEDDELGVPELSAPERAPAFAGIDGLHDGVHHPPDAALGPGHLQQLGDGADGIREALLLHVNLPPKFCIGLRP